MSELSTALLKYLLEPCYEGRNARQVCRRGDMLVAQGQKPYACWEMVGYQNNLLGEGITPLDAVRDAYHKSLEAKEAI